MAEVRVMPTENGPYRVTGPIELVDHEGNPIDVPGETIFLCRCGGSTNKPFCDGTHSKIGFQSAIAAVAQTEEGGAGRTVPKARQGVGAGPLVPE